jgi:hypothetical protein
MLFTIDPKQFTYCGQIQIRKITRTRDNKNEIERILNSFQNRFGSIVKLIMAYSNRINNPRDNTTMAFLQYERSASHADAIRFFTDENPIIYCGKVLKFIPAGFTNAEKCSQYNDYASQRKRANALGPVFEAPNYAITTAITTLQTQSDSPIELTHTQTRQAATVPSTTVNPTIPLELSETVVNAIVHKLEHTIICGTCHQTCKWIHYPNHRCVIACKERQEALEVANNIHEKLRTGQRENFVVHFIREKCWLCLEELHTFAFNEIKLMCCGHLMHKACFNKLATEKGIPMAQTQIELNNEINGEITSCQLIIKDSSILNHRLVICEICRKATYTQTHDYMKAIYKQQQHSADIILDEMGNV